MNTAFALPSPKQRVMDKLGDLQRLAAAYCGQSFEGHPYRTALLSAITEAEMAAGTFQKVNLLERNKFAYLRIESQFETDISAGKPVNAIMSTLHEMFQRFGIAL